MYDVIIIGAGPSGSNGFYRRRRKRKKVLLLEKGKKPGNKLAISGGGRCNVTNRCHKKKSLKTFLVMVVFYTVRFPYSITKILLTFSKVLGVPLKEEDHGRMFPVSNKARDVVNALLTEMDRLHVERDLKLGWKSC